MKLFKSLATTTANLLATIDTAASAANEVALTAESLARTGKGMATRTERRFEIEGSIELAKDLKKLGKAAKKAELSDKELESLAALGIKL